jgi:nucleoside-diphosphate-sugar epimerase
MEEDSSRKLVICRPAVIFGHGEGGNFTRMAKLLKKGFFIYPGRKDTVKACFYVGDLLEAIEYAARHNQRFTLLNGCYPDRYTMEQIVDTFRQHHFPRPKPTWCPNSLFTPQPSYCGRFRHWGLVFIRTG